MGRVLFAWELGDGLGHLGRLAPLARALAGHGHEAIWAVRSLPNARAVLGDTALVVPAPQVPPARLAASPVTFGDLLACVGYGDPVALDAQVAGWESIARLVRPALVVADFAPTAALALSGSVPIVRIGDRFTLPSAETTHFPPFRGGGAVVPEERLLAVVAGVLRARGRVAAATLPANFRSDEALLCILPEVDPDPRPAGDLRSVGPLEPLPGPAEAPPTVDFFAYLSASHPVTPTVLRALRSTGLRGSVYLRDAAPAVRERFRTLGLVLHDRPPPLATAAAAARFVVHHGGLSTAQTCLALGRPQVVVPRHAEQALTARCLAARGAGTVLSPEGLDEARAADVLLGPFDDPRPRALARAIAARPADGLAGATTGCLRWLAA